MNSRGRKLFNLIISLLVSVVAWAFVVYNNDPMTEMKYKDVPVAYVGEEVLANEGLGVAQVSTEYIDVTLSQRRVDTNDISVDDITVIADVSNAAEGENGISLQISGPDGTKVSNAETRSVSVEVEESDAIEKDISVEFSETVPGYEPVLSDMTSTRATIIGAQSEVARVDRLAVIMNFEDVSSTSRGYTMNLTALDENGDTMNHLVIYPDEINFRAYSGITKEVPLKVITEDPDAKNSSDDNDDGYTRTYTAPQRVTIKGPAMVINDITEVSTQLVNINNMYESQTVELEYDLPGEVQLANASMGLTMDVKVTKKQAKKSSDESGE